MGRKSKERREKGTTSPAPFDWPALGYGALACGRCALDEDGEPPRCRPDGATFDAIKVARGYLDHESWAFSCVCDLQWNHPEACLELVRVALPLCRDGKDRAYLAAGALESVLGMHGDRMIGGVEAEARRDPAFRELLTGVWRHGMSEHVWRRVLAASGRAEA